MLLVLGTALVLSAALAWQAIDALRSHQRVTDGALGDYAAIASWELARELEARLFPSLQAVTFEAALGGRRTADEAAAPDGATLAERFAVAARGPLAWCACDDALEALFVVELRTRAVHVSGRASIPSDAPLASSIGEAVEGRRRADGGPAPGRLIITSGGRRVETAMQGPPAGRSRSPVTAAGGGSSIPSRAPRRAGRGLRTAS